MRYLADEGIVVPSEIPSDEDSVPLDFTRLSRRDVGAVHSRYAARHAHAIFRAAVRASSIATIKRNLRFEKAKFRMGKQGEFKHKYELDDAMEFHPRIAKLEKRLLRFETELQVIDAVAAGYEDLRNAASREMSRRSSEQAQRD